MSYKMKITSLLITTTYCFSLLAWSTPSYAQDGQFGAPIMKGSGCSGSSKYSLTPNKKTLSISFKKFIASPSNKSCSLTIPITVPAGMRVSTLTANYQGFVKGKGELKRSYKISGSGKTKQNNFTKNKEGDSYYIKDNLAGMSKKVSKCGENMVLKINARVKASNSSSSISVDSSNSSSGAIFHLQYKSC